MILCEKMYCMHAFWEEEFDKLINLSFSLPSDSTAHALYSLTHRASPVWTGSSPSHLRGILIHLSFISMT